MLEYRPPDSCDLRARLLVRTVTHFCPCEGSTLWDGSGAETGKSLVARVPYPVGNRTGFPYWRKHCISPAVGCYVIWRCRTEATGRGDVISGCDHCSYSAQVKAYMQFWYLWKCTGMRDTWCAWRSPGKELKTRFWLPLSDHKEVSLLLGLGCHPLWIKQSYI